MTFTLPEELANQFVRQVSARDRSRYVAEAIGEKLAERNRQLIRACEVANQDADVAAIEREWDAMTDPVAEPWKDG